MLEPLGDQLFEGYTDGRLWNGWACPYFTKTEAEKLVQAWRTLGYKADYDSDADMYRFAPLDGEENIPVDLADEEKTEHFGAVDMDRQKLYPIGSGAWIWDVADDHAVAEA